MGKVSVTLDTNVIISAFGWGGKPRQVLDKIIAGEIDLFISYDQFNEFARVLNYQKFAFTEIQKEIAKQILLRVSTMVKTQAKVNLVKKDESDNRVIECAIIANVDYIVTGDKSHLIPIRKVGKIRIVTAKELLESIQ